MPSVAFETREQSHELNELVFAALEHPQFTKKAEDQINSFTRQKVREEGFWRLIMPQQEITNAELDRQIMTDKPCKIIDKEPGSPAAVSLPFATLPTNTYIRGQRYLVTFCRIATPRFYKDVDELRTWNMDIRQVLSDNSIRDMLAEEDSKFIAGVNAALIGADTPTYWSGVVQWETIHGGISRDTMAEARKIMPGTMAHLEPNSLLINNVTVNEWLKFGRDEIGGDLSEELFIRGWTQTQILNTRAIVTIKTDLVPNDSIFWFGDPKFIGKSYVLTPTTMYIHRVGPMLEFFSYETIGGTIGFTAALARSDFA